MTRDTFSQTDADCSAKRGVGHLRPLAGVLLATVTFMAVTVLVNGEPLARASPTALPVSQEPD